MTYCGNVLGKGDHKCRGSHMSFEPLFFGGGGGGGGLVWRLELRSSVTSRCSCPQWGEATLSFAMLLKNNR